MAGEFAKVGEALKAVGKDLTNEIATVGSEAIGLRVAISVLLIELALMSPDPKAKGAAIIKVLEDQANAVEGAGASGAQTALREIAAMSRSVFDAMKDR